MPHRRCIVATAYIVIFVAVLHAAGLGTPLLLDTIKSISPGTN